MKKINLKFNHIGLLLENNSTAKKFLNYINFKKKLKSKERKQGVELEIYKRNATPSIELVSPIKNNKKIENLLKKYKETFYHISFELKNKDDLEKIVEKFRMICILKPTHTNIFKKKITYYYLKNFGMIEFILNYE